MESVRTRSRGKQQQQQQQKKIQIQQEGSWRGTTDETDEEDEERMVPVISGENKRKRAPRSASSARRVKLKTLTQYEGGSDREGEVSGSTEDTGNAEHGDAASGRETDAQVVERRRESSRVKIKTLKVRENAEAKADTKPTRVKEKKDGKDVQKRVEDEKPVESTPQRPLKVHLTVSDTAKPKIPAANANTNAVNVQQKPKVGVPQPSTNVAPALSPQTPNNAVHSSSTAPSGGQKASDLETHDTISSPDQEELETALKVIKKLMKMDAAQPFNKPVDPIAQGVPDYLEIIDTPMDFGTICENLEKRQKYKNALDVYRDIQQIWTNCRKYNHKGDPILELMKKVQKACSKYWTANGVLRDPKKSKKGEAHAMEQPSEIFIAKATSHHPEDSNKLRPGAGTSSHKGTCGCVVCVAVRRKAARERRAVGLGSARAVKRQIAKMKGKQDLSDLDMEELMQLDETFLDQVEEADHFYPASYQIPLRPIHPLVLSLGQSLFRCRPEAKKQNTSVNPFVAIVSAYAGCKQS